MDSISINEIIYLLAVLAAAAAVAGFMAGLLGVGGGIIMVPALYYAFTVLGFDIVTRMHLSVGTSLAIIIPTSIISTKTHIWVLVEMIEVGIIIANDVPTDKCILVTISKPKTVKA